MPSSAKRKQRRAAKKQAEQTATVASADRKEASDRSKEFHEALTTFWKLGQPNSAATTATALATASSSSADRKSPPNADKDSSNKAEEDGDEFELVEVAD